MKTLLVEDNDEFTQVATEVLRDHSFERARTYLEAVEKLKQGNYRFHIVDGFFPYGARVPNEVSDEFIAEGALDGNMPFEQYIEIVMNGKDGTLLPLGAFFARDLKRKGIDNYLICSAADHHSYTYSGLLKLADKWDLKLHMIDEAGKRTASKSTREYWEAVAKKIN